MSALGFKCGDYPKGPHNSQTHCCAHNGGAPLDSTAPCSPGCEGFMCDACFAKLQRSESYLDGRPVPALAAPVVPTCAECGAPVTRPLRGATARYCGAACRAKAASARQASTRRRESA